MADVVHGIKRRMARPARRFGNFISSLAAFDTQKKIDEIPSVDKGVQILLAMQYRQLCHLGMPLPRFDEVEFRTFSQNGEDGILHYIFSLIGTTNKRCAEMCVEDGLQCNTANLIINHGWTGLLFDGDAEKIAFGREYYGRHPDTVIQPPTLVNAWIDRDNANALIASHGFEGELDLFSLDMDGVDYWILDSITCIRPRVIVLEFAGAWGPEVSVTIPYRSNFHRTLQDPQYCGASLAAFTKLAKRKGYRLVGCQRLGFNAFFIRDGVGEDLFPEITPRQAYARLNWTERDKRQVESYSWENV